MAAIRLGAGAAQADRPHLAVSHGEGPAVRAARQQTEGTNRKLVGFTIDERAIPRHGHGVFYGGVSFGEVRSGTMSPTLGAPIGTCYLPSAAAVVGTQFEIDIRGRMVPARVVKLPFYKRVGKA